MAKFQILRGSNGQYHARLKANNNEIICWTENYVSKLSAQKAIQFIKTNAPSAPTYDLTV